MIGEVVKLDRKFPLVRMPDGTRLRCEHATNLKKRGKERAVIGDVVDVSLPEGHDMGIIEKVHPRRTTFIRKDPTERTLPQVLAANFDRVIIVQPVTSLNLKRLERELVLAHETNADVVVLLTKADLASKGEIEKATSSAEALAGRQVSVHAISREDAESMDWVRRLTSSGTSVLIGRSGVGKSTLVNALLGKAARATSSVRESDGKGRHTTVSREIMDLPAEKGQPAGRIIDMPGVRGLGLWDAEEGMSSAFADIEELATACKFRDCSHKAEPGCAVRAAVERGEISPERLASYLGMQDELAETARRRKEAAWRKR